MKTPMTAAAVHKQYEEGITAFQRHIGDPTVRVMFGREVDSFMRRCAKGVWKEDRGLSPLHVEYHNAIYCRGNAVPTVLYWDLANQVENFPGFELPDFFRKMTEYDLRTGERISRRFVDIFTLMMLLFAAVDGIVSEAEAGFVNRCADSMTTFCDRAGVSGGKPPMRVDDFVTRKPDGTQVQTGEKPEQTSENEEEKLPKEPELTLDELLVELDELCGLERLSPT